MAFRDQKEENENSPFILACMASLAVGVITAVCMLAAGATVFAAVAAGLTLACIGLMVSAIFTCCWSWCQDMGRSATAVNGETGPKSTLTSNRFLATQRPSDASQSGHTAFSLGASGGSRSYYAAHFHNEAGHGLNHPPAVCLTEPWWSGVPATPTYDPRLFTPSGNATVTVASSELVHRHR